MSEYIVRELRTQLVLGTVAPYEVFKRLRFMANYSTDQVELLEIFRIITNSSSETYGFYFSIAFALLKNDHFDENLKKYLRNSDLEIPEFVKKRYDL